MAAFRIFRRIRELLDVDLTGITDGDSLTYDEATETFLPGASGGGGGGAPTTVDYLVGTASGSLSAEIVAGTSPGGELGGTWASPTVDATHSGSTHAAVQAAAEATAASALTTHTADTTAVHGITDTAALVLTNDSRLTDGRAPTGTAAGVLSGTYPNPGFAADMATQAELDAVAAAKANTSHVHAGEDITSGTVADARIASTIARDSEVTSAVAALSSVYQPLDADLTAVAALTTTAYGRAFLGLADAAAARTAIAVDPIPWTWVTKVADESVTSNTTAQNDDELFFATVNGGLYEIEAAIIYACPVGAGSPDIKISLGEDTTIRGAFNVAGVISGADAVSTGSLASQSNASITFGTAAANRIARLNGSHAAAGGTYRLLWAQVNSDANAVTVRAGSVLRYRRLL